MQFISQFGFTGQTPSYTNSFKSPPKQGDVDYSLRSKRFNSDKEIQQDGTRQKVNICFVVSTFTLRRVLAVGKNSVSVTAF